MAPGVDFGSIFIDVGLILEGLGIPKVAKQPSESRSKNVGKKNGELLGKGPRRPGASGGEQGGWREFEVTFCAPGRFRGGTPP